MKEVRAVSKCSLRSPHLVVTESQQAPQELLPQPTSLGHADEDDASNWEPVTIDRHPQMWILFD